MDPTTTDAAPPRAIAELADVVRSALATRYDLPVVVVAERERQVAVLEGAPLSLARAAAGPDADRVVALGADHARTRLSIPATGVRVWRQFGKSGDDGELVTEALPEDVSLLLLFERDGWKLVETWNGARGWLVPGTGIAADAAEDPADAWLDGRHLDRESFVREALTFEGRPYVWGGTTDAGVDCSGLVVRAASRAIGACAVPRHSRAMLDMGTRVAPSNVERGDVLVLKRDASSTSSEARAHAEGQAAHERATGAVSSRGPAIHPMHVAIALSADEVLHASRDSMRVVREPLETLRERYRVLGVRRLGAGGSE